MAEETIEKALGQRGPTFTLKEEKKPIHRIEIDQRMYAVAYSKKVVIVENLSDVCKIGDTLWTFEVDESLNVTGREVKMRIVSIETPLGLKEGAKMVILDSIITSR